MNISLLNQNKFEFIASALSNFVSQLWVIVTSIVYCIIDKGNPKCRTLLYFRCCGEQLPPVPSDSLYVLVRTYRSHAMDSKLWETCIVGAGIIGSATAYNLVAHCNGDVLLIEQVNQKQGSLFLK